MHLHLLTSFLFFLFFLLLPQTVTTFFSIKYFASHKNLAFASFLTNVLIKNDVRAQLDFFLSPTPSLPSFLDSSSFGFFYPIFFYPAVFHYGPCLRLHFSSLPPHPSFFFSFFLSLLSFRAGKKKLKKSLVINGF